MEGIEVIDGLYLLPFGGVLYRDHVIIADLHLGFEEEMYSKGVYLPPAQLKRALEVLELSSELSKKVIIAGDLKHIFSKLGKKEQREVKAFLDRAEEMDLELVLVRGNHDNFVKHLLEERGFDVVTELDLGEVKVVHGHEDLQLDGVVLMGHEHPSLAIRDEIGVSVKFPCFLKVPLEKGLAIVLPAIGPYQTGNNVGLHKEAYLSPIIRSKGRLREAVPYVIDEELSVVEFPPLSLLEGSLVA